MAAKPSTVLPQPYTLFSSTAPKISPEIDPLYVSKTLAALQIWGINESLPQTSHANGFFSEFTRSFINVDRVERGQIICTVSVKPPISNYFDRLHGGGLASVAELISIACARTVVAEDKQIFLGELSMSYLSGAPVTAEVIDDASVVKSGRNLTVVVLEFKLKKTEKLIYKAQATFYNYPLAKAEVIADASVVKSGRNLTVVVLEFKLKKTEKLIYKAQATFYNYPLAKL